MNDSQIILAVVIVGLSIIMPIYYSYKRKKAKAAERSAEALERMQIREYGRNINEETRARRN
tara:strand:- start:1514 stop:1699 length:186 start_codon:yes stop_codon:yes gene_type:complete